MADSHGNVIHLGERDCSIQRRHQKVIEEAPGPRVDAEMRERIGKIATDAAAAVGYRGAGTVEGMQVGDEYFFLEMNTRVQVEHCVTEMVSGVDIVREQVLVAAGEALSLAQEDVELRGHAIECRINAEAAHKKFAPAPGAITTYREPAGPGVRVDSGVEAGSEVTPMYDPMVAKLIVWDVDREQATRRMLRALGEYEVGGLTTLIPFHEAILATEQWARGETCRDLMEDRDWLKSTAPEDGRRAPEAEEGAELVARDYKVEVSGKLFDVKVIGEAGAGGAARGGRRQAPAEARAQGGWRRRRLQRGTPVAAAGHRLQSRRRAGRRGRRGRPDLRHRGDEDGERDHRPPLRQSHLPERHSRRRRQQRRHPRRYRVAQASLEPSEGYPSALSRPQLLAAAFVPVLSAAFPVPAVPFRCSRLTLSCWSRVSGSFGDSFLAAAADAGLEPFEFGVEEGADREEVADPGLCC